MGFGYLLFGYLFFCGFTLRTHSGLSFDVMPDLVAWIFLAIGCMKLGKWSKLLKSGAVLCFVMAFPSALQLFHGLWLIPAIFPETVYTAVFPIMDTVCRMAFHYLMLFGVIEIASACENQEDFVKSLKARVVLVSVCFVLLCAVRVALLIAGDGFRYYAALAASILTMCYLIPVVFSLFSAYRRITLG